MALSLCVLLWCRPGRDAALIAYEDAVLALLADHGGRVCYRRRAVESTDGPIEVQLLEFADERSLASFMNDDRRQAMAADRAWSVARTEVIRVTDGVDDIA